jgi:hypothetical protein
MVLLPDGSSSFGFTDKNGDARITIRLMPDGRSGINLIDGKTMRAGIGLLLMALQQLFFGMRRASLSGKSHN